jgi:hypothetical protein
LAAGIASGPKQYGAANVRDTALLEEGGNSQLPNPSLRVSFEAMT